MADAFSVHTKEAYVEFAEAEDTRHVTLTLHGPGKRSTITLDAEDMARALLTASPAFVTGVGEIAQRAILLFLGVDEEGNDTGASTNNGDQYQA